MRRPECSSSLGRMVGRPPFKNFGHTIRNRASALGPFEKLAVCAELTAGIDEVGGQITADILEHPLNLIYSAPVWAHILV
jgi:hypothetical protein